MTTNRERRPLVALAPAAVIGAGYSPRALGPGAPSEGDATAVAARGPDAPALTASGTSAAISAANVPLVYDCGSNAPSGTGTAGTGSAGSAGSGQHATGQDKAVKIVECIREHGVPPEPDAKRDFVFGIDVSPAVWQRAVDACGGLAGLMPALRASRLPPTVVLRDGMSRPRRRARGR